MFIRVNEKHVMWGDPGRTIWITTADREPACIDLDSLTEQTKVAVKQAIFQGILFETDELGKPLKNEKNKISPFAGKQVILTASQSFEDNIEQGELGVSTEVYQKAKTLVKSGLSTIRREVQQLTSAQFLRVCIELEKKNKNRKTVLSLFEGQLSKAKDLNNPVSLNFYESIIEDVEEKIVVISPEEGEHNGTPSNS